MAQLMLLALTTHIVSNAADVMSTNEYKMKKPQRVLLVSHQRSGTHFAASVLSNAIAKNSKQHVIKGELMDANKKNDNVTLWSLSTEEVFAELIRQNPESQVVGFILQVSHIWCTMAKHSSMRTFPDCIERFGVYVKERDIKIIHLVRETSLLVITSRFFVKHDHVATTHNATIAAEQYTYALNHPMQLTATEVQKINELDARNAHIFKILSASLGNQRYHYLRYESLIDFSRREDTLRQLIVFLGVFDTQRPQIANEDDLQQRLRFAFDATDILQIRPPSCSSRVKDWDHAKSRLKQSTRDACDTLDRINFFMTQHTPSSYNDTMIYTPASSTPPSPRFRYRHERSRERR